MWWQVQDAKQRFSELLRTAHAEGPQIVTRHGEEIAVVIELPITGTCAATSPSSSTTCDQARTSMTST